MIGDLAPGESVEVKFEFDWNGEEKKEIALFNVGKYDMMSGDGDTVVIWRCR